MCYAVPLPTYFVCGRETQTDLIDKHPEGGFLCKNLCYLGAPQCIDLWRFIVSMFYMCECVCMYVPSVSLL